jgi:hypothetical protein
MTALGGTWRACVPEGHEAISSGQCVTEVRYELADFDLPEVETAGRGAYTLDRRDRESDLLFFPPRLVFGHTNHVTFSPFCLLRYLSNLCLVKWQHNILTACMTTRNLLCLLSTSVSVLCSYISYYCYC